MVSQRSLSKNNLKINQKELPCIWPLRLSVESMENKLIIGTDFFNCRACGVILYILLCGRPPFYGKDTQAILQSIKKGIYTLDREPFYKCSNEAKDLISKLLVKDPQKRYTALKAYEHPWTKK